MTLKRRLEGSRLSTAEILRVTTQIADAMVQGIKPDGVGVVIEAEHLCMTMRGIKKPGSKILTSAVRGLFRSRSKTRSEFFSLLEHNK